MTKRVTISDELAALLEARRRQAGFGTLDAAAESILVQGLAADEGDHSAGYSAEELRRLIDEAEESGAPAAWDAAAARAEVLRRYSALRRG
jgi:hypothetical protein